MAVTSILRDTPNNVSIVRMISTDTVAAVSGANYILKQMPNIMALNSGSWSWYITDMILCSCSDGNALYEFTDSTFHTLEQYGAVPAGSVTPQQVQDQAFTFNFAGGVANTYTLTLSPPLSGYQDGQLFLFTPGHTNTGPSTINISGLGPINILNNNGTTIPANALLANGKYIILYDGALPGFVLVNPSASSGGNLNWSEVTGLTQAAAVDNGYVTNNAAPVTVTLPATAPQFSVIAVVGKGAGGWVLQANAGQTIQFGNVASSSGGSWTSSTQFDTMYVICTTANLVWTVTYAIGNPTQA